MKKNNKKYYNENRIGKYMKKKISIFLILLCICSTIVFAYISAIEYFVEYEAYIDAIHGIKLYNIITI